MKLTSSPLVNRVLLGMIAFTALIIGLHFFDSLQSNNYELEEATDLRKRAEALQHWSKAQPPDGSFSVLMPQPHSLLTNMIQSASGSIPTIQLSCVDHVGQGVYIAAYTVFPPNADLAREEAIHENVRGRLTELGEIRREKRVVLQGITGRETELEVKNGTNLMIMRAFIAGHRLYQVTAAVPHSLGLTTNTWRFLDSLQINTNEAGFLDREPSETD